MLRGMQIYKDEVYDVRRIKTKIETLRVDIYKNDNFDVSLFPRQESELDDIIKAVKENRIDDLKKTVLIKRNY